MHSRGGPRHTHFCSPHQGLSESYMVYGYWSWSSSCKLKFKSGPRRGPPAVLPRTAAVHFLTSTYNLNFNSNTHKPYMILKALDVLFQMPPVSPSNSLWFRRYEFLKFGEIWTQSSSTSTCSYATVELTYLQVEVELGSGILQGLKAIQGQHNCKVWALYDMLYSTWVTLRDVFNLGPKIERFGAPISKNPAQQRMHGRVKCFSGLI
jgi:hypothetical protein